jgi:peptidoglycan/xylan/chitin deacetylase (PgdA/CDA1 family)
VAALLLAAGCGAPSGRPDAGPGSATPSSPTQPSATTAPPSSVSATPSPADRIDLHADPAAVLRRADDVPVLCYHQIRDRRPSDTAQAKPYIMPVATFTSQMRYLATHGFHPISPDRLLAHLTAGAPLPPKPVLLTFDDADENQYANALPALRKYHFTATFFAMTVVLGKKHYMSADQLRSLQAAGMTVGGHTWDHHRVDRYTGDDWHRQIAKPTARLAGILGHPIHYFAYPYGVTSPDAVHHLRDAGYWAAFQLTANPVSPENPRFTLQRYIANPAWNLTQFAAHLHP